MFCFKRVAACTSLSGACLIRPPPLSLASVINAHLGVYVHRHPLKEKFLIMRGSTQISRSESGEAKKKTKKKTKKKKKKKKKTNKQNDKAIDYVRRWQRLESRSIGLVF